MSCYNLAIEAGIENDEWILVTTSYAYNIDSDI